MSFPLAVSATHVDPLRRAIATLTGLQPLDTTTKTAAAAIAGVGIADGAVLVQLRHNTLGSGGNRLQQQQNSNSDQTQQRDGGTTGRTHHKLRELSVLHPPWPCSRFFTSSSWPPKARGSHDWTTGSTNGSVAPGSGRECCTASHPTANQLQVIRKNKLKPGESHQARDSSCRQLQSL